MLLISQDVRDVHFASLKLMVHYSTLSCGFNIYHCVKDVCIVYLELCSMSELCLSGLSVFPYLLCQRRNDLQVLFT